MIGKLIEFLMKRLVLVGILILLQLALLIFTVYYISDGFYYFYFLFPIISIGAALSVVNRQDNPAYKLAWVASILTFPLVGGVMYLLMGNKKLPRRMRKFMLEIYDETKKYNEPTDDSLQEIKEKDTGIYKLFYYLEKKGHSPVHKNTKTKYLSPGEEIYEAMLKELQQAEHFIFLEFFIVEEGILWNSILEILKQKAALGVDVRFIYDDLGCVNTLPYGYFNTLEEMNIKTKVFNPYRPSLSVRMNNRDHRKLLIIDGKVGFTGGMNLADEYINIKKRFGHWKDAAVMLKGDGVWNMTVMFLQLWNYGNDRVENFYRFKPHHYQSEPEVSDGYVAPYSDSPLDNETTAENVFLHMIHHAKEYLYINTPYFIVNNEIMTALTLAAKSGIDVRIVTPGIPDKKYIHIQTQDAYPQLLKAGVRVYEYSPGFLHSKTFLSDDDLAIVGTVNLDYRSLFLHFECGVLMYESSAIMELKRDFQNTLKDCKEIKLDDLKKVPLWKKTAQIVLKLFAPLM